MPRLRFPGLALAVVLACSIPAGPTGSDTALAQQPTIVGPSRILFVDADTVRVLVTKQWQSAASRHQEKLLRTSLRLQYWRNRIPADMRMVFDALGYPTGRVLAQPTGHSEEWWYYGQLAPPLRFRDGVLLDRARFESLARR
ncbi:MAG TPA: hypothetical protein VLT84_12220 [Acidobacteriota bacterium]|nr:hypothetical protein [Acidobacteriota bacterium]